MLSNGCGSHIIIIKRTNHLGSLWCVGIRLRQISLQSPCVPFYIFRLQIHNMGLCWLILPQRFLIQIHSSFLHATVSVSCSHIRVDRSFGPNICFVTLFLENILQLQKNGNVFEKGINHFFHSFHSFVSVSHVLDGAMYIMRIYLFLVYIHTYVFFIIYIKM